MSVQYLQGSAAGQFTRVYKGGATARAAGHGAGGLLVGGGEVAGAGHGCDRGDRGQATAQAHHA